MSKTAKTGIKQRCFELENHGIVNEIIWWLCKVERLVVLDFNPFMIELMAIMYYVFCLGRKKSIWPVSQDCQADLWTSFGWSLFRLHCISFGNHTKRMSSSKYWFDGALSHLCWHIFARSRTCLVVLDVWFCHGYEFVWVYSSLDVKNAWDAGN